MDEYVKKLWKKVDEQTNELNEAKRAMRPYTEALKEVREARRQIISEQEEAAKENGLALFPFLKSDLNIPFEQRYSELKAKEAEIEKEKKPYEEAIEKIVQKIKDTKQQIEDYNTNKELIQYKSELEESGLTEADFRRQQIIEDMGTTNDPHLAGYIFPDGSLIKMGKNGFRDDDHRFVSSYFEPGSMEYNNQEEAMWSFIAEGNIRWMPEGPCLTISLNEPLTREQKSALDDIVDYAKEYALYKRPQDKFYVDMANIDGQVVRSFSYDRQHLNARKVRKDIEEAGRNYELNKGQEWER